MFFIQRQPWSSRKRFRYYKQHGDDLAHRFAQEVRTAVGRIAADPGRWRVVEDGVRHCVLRVFPYSILYSMEGNAVLIVAAAARDNLDIGGGGCQSGGDRSR